LGILWAHSNSLVFNNAGARAPGAKAYFFEAGTTTPRASFIDAALTTPHTHPVLADGNGRFPAVFLDYGAYRERVRSAGDTTIWDTDNVPNDAPADPAEGVDANAILTTGDIWFSLKNGTRDGAVRCNGRTIGSATSGATERANTDCAALYAFLWNNLSNTLAPVSGGRGANAAADFTANKAIGLPDMQGTVPVGLAGMGGTDNTALDLAPVFIGSKTEGGSILGNNTHTLSTGQLPTFNPASTITPFTPAGTISQITPAGTISQITPAGSVSAPNITINSQGAGGVVIFDAGGGSGLNIPGANNQRNQVISATASAPTFTGTPTTPTFTGAPTTPTFTGVQVTPSGSSIGSGSQHNNLSRAMTGTWYIKL
jgi:hypothetical protein